MTRLGADGRRTFSAACFAFGSASAVILSGLVSSGQIQASAEKLLRVMTGSPVWRIAAGGILLPTVILLAGLSLAGGVLVPAATVLSGAAFGWAVSCLCRSGAFLPRTALLPAAAALPMLPALVLLGASGMRLSAMLRAVILQGGVRQPDFRGELLRSVVSGAVIPASLLLLSLCLRSGI